jgi:hypothetical protein
MSVTLQLDDDAALVNPYINTEARDGAVYVIYVIRSAS